MEFSNMVWCFLIILLSMQTGEAANVALNKSATQCHYFDRNVYPASLANNGWKENLQQNNTYPDIAVTDPEGNKWWKVDLEENYYLRDVIIYSRLDCCQERLNKVYILTASKATPANPAPSNTDWTIRWYKHGVVGSTAPDYQERIILYTTDTVRHVAIYKESLAELGLREVEIFNYPDPSDAPVNQINPSTVQLSSNAQKNGGSTDGLINMFNGLYEIVNGNTTWTAQLDKLCNRCYVKIYPHLYKNKSKDDFSKLSNFTIQAHERTGTTPPGYGWTVCETYENYQNGPLIVFCNLTGINFIRIRNNKQSEVIELTEVQVFARESGPVSSLSVFGSSTDCITITWSNPAQPNGVIAGYKVKCGSRSENTKSATDKSHQECNYLLNQVVTCTVKAVNEFGDGVSDSSTGTTLCGKPSTPTFSLTDAGTYDDNGKTRRKLLVSNIQVANHNCNNLNRVEIFLYEGQTPIGSKVTRTGENIDNVGYWNLDAVTKYRVEILAYNDKNNVSNKGVKTLTTGQLPPEQVNSFNVNGINPNCVSAVWTPPAVSNGEILSYSISCTNQIQRFPGADTRSRVICGYNPYKSVSCTIRAVNSFEGEQRANTGITWCDIPTSPTFDLTDAGTHTNNYGKLRRKIRVSNIQVDDINCGHLTLTKIKVYDSSRLAHSEEFQNQNNREILDLDAVTEYKVVVSVVNNGNIGSRESDPQEMRITTRELPPGQVNSFTVDGINSSCVRVDWTPPTVTNGEIQSYRISCTNTSQLPTGSLSRLFCGYTPYELVSCTIMAVNSFEGQQRTATGRSWCGIPSTPTFDLSDSGTRTNNNGELRRKIRVFNIQVGNINCADLRLTKMKVYDGTTLVYNQEFQNQNDTEILNLDAVTEYVVIVSVVNNGNTSSGESEPREMRITTGELPPETAPVIVRLALNSSCGTLEWRQPVIPNGIIRYYQVDCQNEEQQKLQRVLASDHKQYSFCNLTSATRVNCKLTANNSMGSSPEATREGYTEIAFREPSKPPNAAPTPDTIQISIDAIRFPDEKTRLEYYEIIVERVNARRTNRRRRDTSESVVRSEMLYNFTTAESMNLTYYVAARLYNQTEDKIDFVCGDNQTYGGYYNKPLEAGVDYRIHYTYTVNLSGEHVSYLETSTNTYRLADPTTDRPPEGPNLALLGLIALVTLPLAAIGFILVRCRRSDSRDNRAREDKRETQLNTINLQQTRATDALELDENMSCDDRAQHVYLNIPAVSGRPESNICSEPTDVNPYSRPTDATDGHLYTKLPGVRETLCSNSIQIIEGDDKTVKGEDSPENMITDQSVHEDVSDVTRPSMISQQPVQRACSVPPPPGRKEIVTSVETMNGKLVEYESNPTQSVIYFEFQAIQKELSHLQPDYSNGRKHCNMLKNVNPDVLPDEFSRVVLAAGSSDYINAIVIDGFKKRSEFIVTQIPLQRTVTDFWLMVHEQKIVNLIQLEDSKILYIPDNDGESLTFDDFTICRVTTQNEGNLHIIRLEMSPPHITSKKQKVEEITVFRYLDWNEENIPDKHSLIVLYLIVKRDMRSKYRSPALIMCSNGATKSGVYVNMYSILERLELEQIVDVYKSVLQTRSRRPQFVFDIESYVGLYEIVKTFANYYSQYSNFK